MEYAEVAELAVFSRALPVAEKAKAEKAQRSKFAAKAKANFGHRKSIAQRVCLKCVFKCGLSKTLHLGRPCRVKCRGQNGICRSGGIGRRARFRF